MAMGFSLLEKNKNNNKETIKPVQINLNGRTTAKQVLPSKWRVGHFAIVYFPFSL